MWIRLLRTHSIITKAQLMKPESTKLRMLPIRPITTQSNPKIDIQSQPNQQQESHQPANQPKTIQKQISEELPLKITCIRRKTRPEESIRLCLTSEFKLYNLETGPSLYMTLLKSDAVKYLRQMATIRQLEQIAAKMYREKIVRGFCHLYIGQEAVCVGCKAAMRPQDEVITAYRCHGWTYMMGIKPEKILMELAGQVTGCMRGKGGSMHMYAPKFYGGNGIVGAHVPLGAGIALASKYMNTGSCVFALYGDGAANQGQIYETYNMAALWKLPIVFCCENNHYGMGTAEVRASSNPKFYTRGQYIPGVWIDGMNVLAVRNAAEFAIEYALSKGPIILEFDTYRFSGHSMSDPGTSYRNRTEIEEMRKTRDPIYRLITTYLETEILSEQECENIKNEVRGEIQEIFSSSKLSEDPSPKELTADVYLNCLEKGIRTPSGYLNKHVLINKQFEY